MLRATGITVLLPTHHTAEVPSGNHCHNQTTISHCDRTSPNHHTAISHSGRNSTDQQILISYKVLQVEHQRQYRVSRSSRPAVPWLRRPVEGFSPPEAWICARSNSGSACDGQSSTTTSFFRVHRFSSVNIIPQPLHY